MDPVSKKQRVGSCTASDILKFADPLISNEPVRSGNVFWLRGKDGKCTPRVKKTGEELRELTIEEKNTCWPLQPGKKPYRNECVLSNGVNIIPLVDECHMGLNMTRETTWKKINKKQIGEMNNVLAYLNEDMFEDPIERRSCVVFPPGFLLQYQPVIAEQRDETPATVENAKKITKIIDEAYNIAKKRHNGQLNSCALSGVESIEDFLKLSITGPNNTTVPIAKHILSVYHLLKLAKTI